MSCPDCGNTGYRTVDVGTPLVPDYIEARCRCNPAPTDADYLAAHPWHDDRASYPGETEYPTFDVPVVDYDPRLPAELLA